MPLATKLSLTLLLAAVITVPGCQLAEYAPALPLPEAGVQKTIAGHAIKDWRYSTADEGEQLLTVYYAIDLIDGDEEQRWWLRVVPTVAPSEEEQKKARKEYEEKAKERAGFRIGALKGLLSEFEAHRDRFIEEQESDPDVDQTWDQVDRESRVWLFVDTCQDAPEASWQRSKIQSVTREIFAADPIAAAQHAARLQEHNVEALTRSERKDSLMGVIRGKQKILNALFVALRSEPLKFVVEHVVERPSPGALTLALGRYAFTSKENIGEWITKSAWIRLGERPVPAEFEAATTSDLSTVQFHPRLLTTHMLRSEIIVGSTEKLPFLSGGLVAMDAMNPYDAERRFKIRLLGWSKERPFVEVEEVEEEDSE